MRVKGRCHAELEQLEKKYELFADSDALILEDSDARGWSSWTPVSPPGGSCRTLVAGPRLPCRPALLEGCQAN
jgi:hypothetical protein